MQNVPYSGRLDLPLACLLIAERYHSLARRTVTVGDLAADVIDLVDLLDVEADDMLTLEEFEEAVGEATERLVAAGWLRRRNYRGVMRLVVAPLGEEALEWVRDRLSERPDVRRRFDELEAEVTDIVVERHGDARAPAPVDG